ncbi:MAG: hypothetical protein Q7R48_03335 [bacterium]|nr:hypothetical protein [bacterium]
MIALDWYRVTLIALQNLWQGVVGFVPALVGALVVFGVGWAFSVGVGKLVADVLKRLRLNQLLDRGAWKKAMDRADLRVDTAEFIGAIIKWVLVIVFLSAAVEILGLGQFAVLLQKILGYLPNVVVASLIFVVAVIISDIVEKVLRAVVEGAQMGHSGMVGVIVRWSIWVVAINAILLQLGVASFLLQTLTTGIVAFLVIAGGLAFGLGGKDVAGEMLQDLKSKLRR